MRKKINYNFFGYRKPPLIITEISGNHNGSKKRFLSLIKSACKNGADLIKIQTYEPEDITLKSKNNAFKIKNGYNQNEIALIPKSLKKTGFFEKFFQLFS